MRMTNEHCWHKLSSRSCKAIQGAWHIEGAIRIEGLLVFGHHPIDAGVPGHMTHQELFVIQQVLTHALVGPVVDKLLQRHIIWPVIWVWNQDGLLDMVREVAAFLDFSKAVVKSSALRQQPQGVDKVAGVSLNIEIMLFPKIS